MDSAIGLLIFFIIALLVLIFRSLTLRLTTLAPAFLSVAISGPLVAEAAVCGRADEITGQAIVAFVTLKGGAEGSDDVIKELRAHVGKKIGPIARPATVVITQELPKTRSGKIMRRLLRDVAENRALGDTTTLADPNVLAEIQRQAQAK